MPEWLNTSLAVGPDVRPLVLFWRIGVALLLGFAVAGLYRWARRGESISPTFLATLILLATLIAMATQIIGDNIARAFSLVGALSVVRFRTVVKDTQDTAFVIFAVVVGMASGSDHLAVALVGLVILSLAALVLWPIRRAASAPSPESRMTLRVALADEVRAAAEKVLSTAADRLELTGVATARQGSAFDLTYRLRLRPGHSPSQLVSELNLVEGVESIELRRVEPL